MFPFSNNALTRGCQDISKSLTNSGLSKKLKIEMSINEESTIQK